jgi:hypothetical protein
LIENSKSATGEKSRLRIVQYKNIQSLPVPLDHCPSSQYRSALDFDQSAMIKKYAMEKLTLINVISMP